MYSIAFVGFIVFLFLTESYGHGHKRSRKQRSISHHNSNSVHVRHRTTTTTELPSSSTSAGSSSTAVVSSTSVPTTESVPTTAIAVNTTQIQQPLPNVAASKSNEGFVNLLDNFFPDNKKYDNKKYDNKKYDYKKYDNSKFEDKKYYKEKENDEFCYKIITSDSKYSKNKDLSFKDISGTGTPVVFSSDSEESKTVAITGTYYFYGEKVPSNIIITTSGTVVLDPNSVGDRGANSFTANLGNSDEAPYSVIAPFWSSFSTASGLNSGNVYYEETDGELIVQWDVNESVELTVGGVFQVRLCEDGQHIVFSYKQLNCASPAAGTAQFGVKPAEGKFSEGQRASLRLSSCINGAYEFPRDNTGVVLKPAKCGELIGQTGIPKPKNNYAYKDEKDEHKKDNYHGKVNKASDNECIDDYFHNFLDSLFGKH